MNETIQKKKDSRSDFQGLLSVFESIAVIISSHTQKKIHTGLVPCIGSKLRYMFIYIDKSAPFQNRISVIHKIFVKFLQTIYFL